MKTDRERDAAIEQLLTGALRDSGGSAEACPGAADLAAFVEGTLSPRERQTIEQHAAGCDRCLHALALMAESPLPASDETAGWRAWLSFARLSWVIPATAAAAIILYIAVTPVIAPRETAKSAVPARPQPPSDSQLASQRVQGQAPAYPAPAEAGGAPAMPANEKRADAERPHVPAQAKSEPTATATPSAGIRGTGQVASADAVQRAPVLNQVSPAAGDVRQEPAISRKAMNAAAPTPAPAAAPQAAPPTVTQVIEAPGARSEQVQMFRAQAERQTQVAAQTATRLEAKTTVLADSAAGEPRMLPTAVVQAPNSSVRWRLDGDGLISRSQDGGTSWQQQQYRSPSELLALSAPTPFTCWVAGRSGTIVLTTDGERWERRPFPEQVDLIAVDARDRRQAVVTTRDGRRFSTADGGNTWTLLAVGRR